MCLDIQEQHYFLCDQSGSYAICWLSYSAYMALFATSRPDAVLEGQDLLMPWKYRRKAEPFRCFSRDFLWYSWHNSSVSALISARLDRDTIDIRAFDYNNASH